VGNSVYTQNALPAITRQSKIYFSTSNTLAYFPWQKKFYDVDPKLQMNVFFPFSELASSWMPIEAQIFISPFLLAIGLTSPDWVKYCLHTKVFYCLQKFLALPFFLSSLFPSSYPKTKTWHSVGIIIGSLLMLELLASAND